MTAPNLNTLRVDQVGSLLRPASLKHAFTQHLAGALSPDDLHQAQDEAIRVVIAAQQAHSLPVLTDGEFRRVHFMESFGEVAGMEQWKRKVSDTIRALTDAPSQAGETKRGSDPTLHTRRPVTEKLRLVRSRTLEEFQFAQGIANAPVKVTLIDVDRIAQGYDAETSRAVYHDSSEFLKDVIEVQREIVGGLAAAGCRYVQIDGPSYTRYVDSNSLEVMRSLGEDPKTSLERAIAADNAVIAGFPDVTFGLHVCRGNRQSMWHREGAYDAIADMLFNGLRHQRLLLEYDTERAGGFEPLRFVSKGRIVVLGLITTKVERVETVDALKRRIDEAARYLPIDQLALSPQCGFASDIRGNAISEDAQWRKLDVMLETARQVWG
jgi:5-methyltetrahydropteroyltriglutamate--homocysteine methyltransferase